MPDLAGMHLPYVFEDLKAFGSGIYHQTGMSSAMNAAVSGGYGTGRIAGDFGRGAASMSRGTMTGLASGARESRMGLAQAIAANRGKVTAAGIGGVGLAGGGMYVRRKRRRLRGMY